MLQILYEILFHIIHGLPIAVSLAVVGAFFILAVVIYRSAPEAKAPLRERDKFSILVLALWANWHVLTILSMFGVYPPYRGGWNGLVLSFVTLPVTSLTLSALIYLTPVPIRNWLLAVAIALVPYFFIWNFALGHLEDRAWYFKLFYRPQ